MNKLKLATIVGTRPEIIRLSGVIKECDKYFEHILIHTGQNYAYELNQIFFNELDIRKPNHFLEAVGDNLGETMGKIIAASYKVLMQEKPDALLVLGDTNSALCVIAAKRLKIPVFHMEAGNRCFDQNVPEEINRKLVDHLSDINLPYTEHSRRYLIAEGFPEDRILVIGSPMLEVINAYREKIEKSEILNKLNLSEGKYILVSAHREENLDIETNFNQLMSSLNVVAEKYQMPVIYSTHPRSQKRIENSGFKLHKLVKNFKPFGFIDYEKLQMSAFCVLSDSGTVTEEASILNFPAVNIRNAHERPEGMDMGTMVMSGVGINRMLEAIEMVTKQQIEPVAFKLIPDYEIDYVSLKVVRIILSYVDLVNRVIWRKCCYPVD
jgi:UDP-N-acetyl-L-fucosamine synthase